jgi:hypothetical protein
LLGIGRRQDIAMEGVMALDAENVLDAPMVPAPADMDDQIDRLADERAGDFMRALSGQLLEP